MANEPGSEARGPEMEETLSYPMDVNLPLVSGQPSAAPLEAGNAGSQSIPSASCAPAGLNKPQPDELIAELDGARVEVAKQVSLNQELQERLEQHEAMACVQLVSAQEERIAEAKAWSNTQE